MNKSAISGLIAGLVAGGLGSKKESGLYSYNGVVLPGLPEWDRGTYPYVVLYRSGFGSTFVDYLYCFKEPYTVYTSGDEKYFNMEDGTQIYQFHCSYYASPTGNLDFAWSDGVTQTRDTAMNAGRVKWSNFDVVHEDGTLYLAKSDPVPVYE